MTHQDLLSKIVLMRDNKIAFQFEIRKIISELSFFTLLLTGALFLCMMIACIYFNMRLYIHLHHANYGT